MKIFFKISLLIITLLSQNHIATAEETPSHSSKSEKENIARTIKNYYYRLRHSDNFQRANINKNELKAYILAQKSAGIEVNLPQKFGTNFSGVDFSDFYLLGLDLRAVSLIECNFEYADVSDIDLSHASLIKANFKAADFSGAILNGANLSEANLENANLKNTSLVGADLSRANLKGANLQGANLSGTILNETILDYANLTKAILLNTKAIKASFNHTNFVSSFNYAVDFKNAVLTDANFYKAKILDCDFDSANIFNTQFERTDLRGSSFKNTDLNKAILKRSKVGPNILIDTLQHKLIKTFNDE